MPKPVDVPADIYEWAEIFCDEHRETDDRELVARAFMAGQAAAQTKSRAGLTPSQVQLLDFVGLFEAEHRCPPTFDEIASGLGLKSKGSIHDKVVRLAEGGFLTFEPNTARSVQLVRA